MLIIRLYVAETKQKYSARSSYKQKIVNHTNADVRCQCCQQDDETAQADDETNVINHL